MSYKVALRDNSTKEIRFFESTINWEDSASLFWWTEGNASCDCNRHAFFEQIADPNYTDDYLNDGDGFMCGDKAYSALYAELPDGTRIPLDDL